MNLVPTVLWGFRADGIQFPPHLLQAANRTIFSFQNFIVLANTHLNFTVKYNRKNFLLPLIAGAFPVAGVTYAIIKYPKAGLTEINKHPIDKLASGDKRFDPGRIEVLLQVKGKWLNKYSSMAFRY